MLKLSSQHDLRIHVKLLYDKKDEEEMKTVIGFEPVHNGKKRMDFLLAVTIPTALSMRTTNRFQNHT